jgi:hypothetical protein
MLALALALAAPTAVEAKKKKPPPPPKVTLSSWQVVVNDNGMPIDVANNGTFAYCPDGPGVTHIYALGTAKPAKKGEKFSVTWKLDGSKLITLPYKTRTDGKVQAPLHKTDNSAHDPGKYTATAPNGSKKSSINITLSPQQSACSG